MKISIRKLREVVRRSLVENEELLKKWALGEKKSEIGQELAKLNIIPIKRGAEDTAKLGEGAFNMAFDVVYRGKRCVARLSHDDREVRMLLKFSEFKSKLPPQYAKHFPEIYTTFKFDTPSLGDYSGAVVELLDPMPPTLKSDLEYKMYNQRLPASRVHEITENPEFIADVVKKIAPYNERVQEELISLFETEIVPFLQKSIGKEVSDVAGAIRKIVNVGKEKNQNGTDAYFQLHQMIEKAIRDYVVPNSSSRDKENISVAKYHTSSAVREFYDFLKALEGAGMSWRDLHTDNFMMRKSTGDLVVVDPGMFD